MDNKYGIPLLLFIDVDRDAFRFLDCFEAVAAVEDSNEFDDVVGWSIDIDSLPSLKGEKKRS